MIVGFAQKLNAQNTTFLDSLFSSEAEVKSRPFVTPKNKYNPIGYLSTAALFIYQNVVSEQIQAQCTYQKSCSEFTKLAIHDYGFLKGTFIGLNQLLSCLPSLKFQTHTLYLTNNDLIINEHYLKK